MQIRYFRHTWHGFCNIWVVERIFQVIDGAALDRNRHREGTSVSKRDKGVELVLIADRADRAAMLRDTMRKSGINGVIRRIAPSQAAIECARKSGAYKDKAPPDLIIFDYSDPTEKNTAVLRDIAFCNDRSRIPVVLLTSTVSQDLLDTGEVDGDSAVMFSPTSLVSFVQKMQDNKRSAFFRALHTLYQYGPILVRMPRNFPACGRNRLAMTA